MKSVTMKPEFDAFANDYDRALDQGLALSGESKAYFAAGRMHWLAKRLAHLEYDPENVLDFGCGTGGSTPYFFDFLAIDSYVGVDVSAESLAVAVERHGSRSARFCRCSEYSDVDAVDLAFTNGVFHHIPPGARAGALQQIFTALKPGGLFAFWENNPWNPGTRFIMSRIPFDRDAELVWPGAGRQLLRQAGFEILHTDFAFIFPSMLAKLRGLEARLCKVALGGQYMILARKPLR
jgi:SAM-dependent methyltransferase